MRKFGHIRPLRDKDGQIEAVAPSPVRVKTVEQIGHGFGPDWDKRLVLTAHAQDLIGLRPERTTREVFIKAVDLYRLLLTRKANTDQLEKARKRKETRARQREARKIKRMEKKLCQ